jgi:RNA polymerase sigma factor (sigma-70 family)
MASGSRRLEPASVDANPSGVGAPADQLLWDRFVARGDQVAFTDLVRRHGPMVLGVCRRVLRHPQDAEDAFQATFLVLARKARSVGQPERLSSWLYGVAYRTALKARSRALARRREVPVTDVSAPQPSDPVLTEVREALDEELNRLPERFRTPLVLCYLEGKSTQDAARELGCPKGTVLSRLARGRDRLRRRLVRRGLVLTGAALAVSPTGLASADEVPAHLLSGTVRGGTGFHSPGQTGPCTLADEVLQAISRQRLLRLVVSGLAILGAVVAGAATYRALPARATAVDGYGASDEDRLQGYWRVVSARVNGSEAAPGKFPVRRLMVRGNGISFEGGGLPSEATFRLDSAVDPKAIDLAFPADGPAGTRQGIYRFDENTLTLCLTAASGRPRPGAFASPSDSGLLLLKCQRGRY